jgi:hypothetical protein
MMMNEGTLTGIQAAAAGNTAAGAGSHFLRPAEAIATRILALMGTASIKVQATAKMTNPVDGMITLKANALAGLHRFDASVDIPVAGGLLTVNEDAIRATFKEALEAAKKITVTASAAPAAPELAVDRSKIEAHRSGNLIFFQHPGFSQWTHTALKASMVTDDGRASIRKDLIDSVVVHVAGMGFVAKVDAEAFKMPMVVDSELPRTVRPHQQFQAAVAKAQEAAPSEAFLQAEDLAHRLRTHGAMPVGIKASQSEPFDSRKAAMNSEVRRLAGPAAVMWASREAKGEKPSITAMDFAGIKANLHGQPEGSALVAVRFYAGGGVQEATLEVPFVAGKVEIEKVSRTAADLEAEKKRADELRILSEAEAAEQMRQFMASKQKDAEIVDRFGGGFQAGDAGFGQNLFTQRAADKTPVLKALMPKGIDAGKHLLVQGYVYRVDPTDYHSTDELHSAFWMLTLTDLPPSKADATYHPL